MQALADLEIMREALTRIQIRNVAAGDEGPFARSGEDDDAHGRVALGLGDGLIQRGERVHVERIQRLRPIDGDDGRGAAAFQRDEFGHELFLYARVRRAAATMRSAEGV